VTTTLRCTNGHWNTSISTASTVSYFHQCCFRACPKQNRAFLFQPNNRWTNFELALAPASRSKRGRRTFTKKQSGNSRKMLWPCCWIQQDHHKQRLWLPVLRWSDRHPPLRHGWQQAVGQDWERLLLTDPPHQVIQQGHSDEINVAPRYQSEARWSRLKGLIYHMATQQMFRTATNTLGCHEKMANMKKARGSRATTKHIQSERYILKSRLYGEKVSHHHMSPAGYQKPSWWDK